MDKRIFKKYPTLGEYYGLGSPYANHQSTIFYFNNREVIEEEDRLAYQVHRDREKMGGDKRIHKIIKDERSCL